MTAPAPTRSFRQIPPAIYIALAAGVIGALTTTIAMLLASGDGSARFMAIRRWFLLDSGCDVVSAILLALGLAELARRYTGRPRVLTRIGAYLGLASLTWIAVRPLVAVLRPSPEMHRLIYEASGLGVSLIALAAAVLLTLGADAWRRAPVAAAILVALGVTGYGVPVIGTAFLKAFGTDPVIQQIYGLGRVGLHTVAMLWIAALLAGGGHAPAPDPRAAGAGLSRARGVLLFRIVAGCLISMMVVAGRSPGAANLVALGGPAVAVITMVLFAIALQRVAGARVEGLPAVYLSLGAALTLWWGTIQLEQGSLLFQALRGSYLERESRETAQWFSIAGPIAATLGLALVGSAIAALARSRGDHQLHEAAAARTAAFLVISLAGIGLQTQLAKATTASGALAILLLAALLGIVAIGVLVGLLARGAQAIEAEPELPPARVL